MQFLYTNATPLAANAVYTSPWFLADPTFPSITVQASSDQAGSLAVYESEQTTGDSTAVLLAGCPVSASAAGAPAVLQTQTRGAYFRIVYTNGAVAQASFAISIASSSVPTDSSANRKLDLILREIRVQSLLLLALKEPTGSSVNMPMGIDDLTQGVAQVPALSAAATPYAPPPFS